MADSSSRNLFAAFGHRLIEAVWKLGFVCRFFAAILRDSGASLRRFPLVIREIYFAGVLSMIIIVVSGLFVGMVLGLQGYSTLARFGSADALGALVAGVCGDGGITWTWTCTPIGSAPACSVYQAADVPANFFVASAGAGTNANVTLTAMVGGAVAAQMSFTFAAGGAPSELTSAGGRAQGRGGYGIPGLYSLAVTAPYLHGGQATTLDALLRSSDFAAHLASGAANFDVMDAVARQDLLNFLLSVFCLVWMADIAAYFGGRTFGDGQHQSSASGIFFLEQKGFQFRT